MKTAFANVIGTNNREGNSSSTPTNRYRLPTIRQSVVGVSYARLHGMDWPTQRDDDCARTQSTVASLARRFFNRCNLWGASPDDGGNNLIIDAFKANDWPVSSFGGGG